MTENELDMKRWLNRAFYAEKKARALEMLVSQCRERAQGLSHSSEGNDTSHSSTPKNGTENAFMKLAETVEKAEAQKAEAACLVSEIWDAISQLHDDDLETVLIHRYILFHTIEQTAELLNYDTRTVYRKIEKAIKKMSANVIVCHPQGVL